jgi:hypothetical protein
MSRSPTVKIKYVSPSPKAGTEEHVRNDVGQTLVAAGFAVAVPLPKRGTNEWLKAIAEIDAMRTKPSEYDTVPPAADGVLWSATILGSGLVRIIKKVGSEVYWFDGPPKECPANVREQFLQLANLNPGANASALDAAKRAQQDADAAARNAFLGVRNVVKVAIRFLKDSDFGWGFGAGQVSKATPDEAKKLVDAGVAEFVKEAK